ncbi:LamG-like jellyroll fold domain-containing protein [Flavobacterium sp. 3HN19-14]|uniref:LamG domain-containing protein n=1 Tax=Flavobacterium sp. 3HN19-14 TaxID=3448133 RepID=UPI003EE1EC10
MTANYEAYTLQTVFTIPATRYFATRARMGGSNSVFTYGGSNGTQGGNWDGSNFVNGTINVSLLNDECSGAKPVTIGANNYNSNQYSTPSAVPVSCASGTLYDTWYSFNPGNYNAMTIKVTAGTQGHDYGYAIYSGDCSNLTELYCQASTANTTDATLMPNTTYYIRVFSDLSNIGGFYIQFMPPACSFTALINGENGGRSDICPGESITLTATGGTSYTWAPANGLSSTTGATVTVTPSQFTDYVVTVSDGNGCEKTAYYTVAIRTVFPIAVAQENVSVIEGGSVTLYAFNGSNYVWTPATGLNTTTGSSVIATPLEDTVYTVTSTDENGCHASKTVTVTVTQPGDNALFFDGGDDYVSVAPYPQTVSGSYTVEAWVQPFDQRNMHIFSTREGGDFTFDISLKSNGSIHADIGDGASWLTTTADISVNYTINTWMHIAYVITPSGYTVYRNGCLAGSGTFSGTPLLIDGSHNISIGKNASENTYFFGAMDDIKVYSTALSQASIVADMAAGAPVLPGSALAYYDFNKGTPEMNNTGITALPDKSAGAHYNGTLNNFQLNTGIISNWIKGRYITTGACTPANGLTAKQISQNTASLQWIADCNPESFDVHVTALYGGRSNGRTIKPECYGSVRGKRTSAWLF